VAETKKQSEKMKSRKYPSFNEAITYLESKGELKYWGRIDAETCIYTYQCKEGFFRLYVHDDGLVEIRE
jgi:hypothetical protein